MDKKIEENLSQGEPTEEAEEPPEMDFEPEED